MSIAPESPPARRRGPGRARGVTLIEVVMFVLIVSVAVVSILHLLGLAVAQSADPLVWRQSLAVAESLVQEIANARAKLWRIDIGQNLLRHFNGCLVLLGHRTNRVRAHCQEMFAHETLRSIEPLIQIKYEILQFLEFGLFGGVEIFRYLQVADTDHERALDF